MSQPKDQPPVAIRRLTAEDSLRDLIALSRDFFQEYVGHHEVFFQLDTLRDEDITGYFAHTLGTEDAATFIAILDGRMIGYITVFVRAQPDFYRVKTVGAISGLMVQKEHRRFGIATLLLDEARRFFCARGVEYMTVYTAAANEAALRFYERNGMTPLHVTLLGETGTRGSGA